MRSYVKSGVVDDIRAAGGEIFAVTSEPQSLATEAEEEWELNFSAIGDPHHEILGICRERGWLDLFVNENTGHMQEARSWASHLNGYFQPGTLALTNTGRVLYRWRCRPTRENVGGAIMRPTADYTWHQIRGRIEQSVDDQSADAPLDDDPELDAKPVFWPLFMLLLLAHGWFLRPKVFPTGRKDEKQGRPDQMWPRIFIFVVVLLSAFALLPVLWSISGLLIWGALVGPEIARYNREFQNIRTGDVDKVSGDR